MLGRGLHWPVLGLNISTDSRALSPSQPPQTTMIFNVSVRALYVSSNNITWHMTWPHLTLGVSGSRVSRLPLALQEVTASGHLEPLVLGGVGGGGVSLRVGGRRRLDEAAEQIMDLTAWLGISDIWSSWQSHFAQPCLKSSASRVGRRSIHVLSVDRIWNNNLGLVLACMCLENKLLKLTINSKR